jgi:hypothetical protein
MAGQKARPFALHVVGVRAWCVLQERINLGDAFFGKASSNTCALDATRDLQ